MSIEIALGFLGIFAFPAAIGILSGFTHCAAMCGPIHLFLAREGGTRLWLYHAGRISTYAVLGAAAGAFAHVVRFPGMRWVWAVVYLVLGLRLLGAPLWPAQWGIRYGAWVQRRLRPLMRRAAMGETWVLFWMGLAAGLLPCATTQAGLAWAAGTAHASLGALGMVLLGVGTLPLFVAVPRRWFPRGGWYHAALGVALIVLASWRVYTLIQMPSHSCH